MTGRKRIFVLWLACFSFCLPYIGASASWAQSDPDGTSDLTALFDQRYAAMKQAMNARNAQAIAALLAPGFVSEDAAGKQTAAAQMIQEVTTLPQDPNKTSHTTILSVKLNDQGDEATINQRYDMKRSQAAPSGQENILTVTALSTDIWVKQNNIWLFKHSTTNQMDVAINGAKIVHQVRQ